MLLINDTLESLQLNHNTIGKSGARALLRAASNSGDRKVTAIGLEECNFHVGTAFEVQILNCVVSHRSVTTVSSVSLVVSLLDAQAEVSHGSSFDPTSPGGKYSLKLEDPFDRTIGADLIRCVGYLNGCSIAKASITALGLCRRRFRDVCVM